MYKRFMCLTLCLVMFFSLALAQDEIPYQDLALKLFDHLKNEDEKEALLMMTPEMAGHIKGQTAAIWASLINAYGELKGIGDSHQVKEEPYVLVETQIDFDFGSLNQAVTFTKEGQVAGWFFKPIKKPEDALAEALPEGLIERETTIIADAHYPLGATLTLPSGEIKAGFVLVHGSGPNDRDESISANKPFLDLAWGLAKRGFAVLRYDKRTFAHGEQMSKEENYAALTVDEETALDAAAAVQTLLSQPELDGRPVFLLGHSMGGMLASYIGQTAKDLSGYVLLGGTPRALWEVILDQNRLVIAEMEPTSAALSLLMLEAEAQKGRKLLELTDEEARQPKNDFAGISAWYLRHWARIDAVDLHMKDGKPVLILQGEKDRQVVMKDFELWKSGLAEHPDATFISYPDLNHLFGAYEGEAVPYAQLVSVEYAQRTPVDETLMDDIASWAEKRIK